MDVEVCNFSLSKSGSLTATGTIVAEKKQRKTNKKEEKGREASLVQTERQVSSFLPHIVAAVPSISSSSSSRAETGKKRTCSAFAKRQLPLLFLFFLHSRRLGAPIPSSPVLIEPAFGIPRGFITEPPDSSKWRGRHPTPPKSPSYLRHLRFFLVLFLPGPLRALFFVHSLQALSWGRGKAR